MRAIAWFEEGTDCGVPKRAYETTQTLIHCGQIAI